MFLERLFAVLVFILWIRSLILAYQTTRKRHLAIDDEQRLRGKKEEWIWGSVAILLTAYASFFFYFGPKAAGEKYVDALRFMNVQEIYDATCSGSEMRKELESQGWTNAIAALINVQIENERFRPLSNRYEFEALLSAFGEENSGPVKLQIKLASPWRFCVDHIIAEN